MAIHICGLAVTKHRAVHQPACRMERGTLCLTWCLLARSYLLRVRGLASTPNLQLQLHKEPAASFATTETQRPNHTADGANADTLAA